MNNRPLNAIKTPELLQLLAKIVMILLIVSFSPAGNSSVKPNVILSPAIFPISLVTSRDQAYYLGPIPAPNSSPLLSFDWNVTTANTVSGSGSIQFSHDKTTWSNLASFELISGEAQGRQPIDSSWANDGANYLRVSFWMSNYQSLSSVVTLKVYENYSQTVLLFFSPFVIVGMVAVSVYILRKRNRQSLPLTQ